MLTLTLTAGLAHEIRLESLDDGPGLLPFKLGPMTLITHHHSFLQYIELDDILSKINIVKGQITELKSKLPNDTQVLFEIQIDYLSSKLNKVAYQLESLEPHRLKRGLVDGMGSIIKSLTGNLDYTDAIKYNNAINNLKNNQDKIASKINSHISLSKEWMTHHTSLISTLVENQIKINDTLHLLLDADAYVQHSLIKYAKLAQLLSIVTDNVDDLSRELQRIENVLAFTRTASTHHSMLGIDTLIKMLNQLENLYSKDQLLDLDLREYYNVIETGSFYSGRQIVIVFKIPIVSPHTYELYKLPIAPNRDNRVLIPPFPLVATNENFYVYIEAECPKYNTRYLCHEKLNQRLRSTPDCIQELLHHQRLDQSCRPTLVTVLREAIQRLDDRHYVAVFPGPTQVHLICGRNDYQMLKGSYLITIPSQCSIRTKDAAIYNTNDRVEGQPMKMLNLTNNLSTNFTAAGTVTLSSINLNDLREIQDKVISQTAVHLDEAPTESLYHTTLPFYVVLSGTVALATILLCRKYAMCFKISNKEPETTSDTELTTDPELAHTYAIPRPVPANPAPQHPATFLRLAQK